MEETEARVETQGPEEEPAREASGRQWRTPLVVGLVAALLTAGIAAGGFFAGRATRSEGPAPVAAAAPVTTTAAAPSTSAAPGTPSAPTVTIPSDPEEPVAAVARALTPSVVQIETNAGLGSGVVYDADDGLILTAAHVVAGADQTRVVLSDGTRLTGTVLGADDVTDVAVVQVDHDGLVAAPLAEGIPLEVGQMAIAIGSPFGLDGSVTAGVVSAPSRAVTGPDGRTRTMIQTDAAINPGNSGGALADRRGRVIGINDQIVSRSGGNEGIGFAIPIDVALRAADSLVAGEPIRAGYLGVTGTSPETGRSGALLTGIMEDSAAERAGLQVGDLIVAVEDTPVGSVEDLAAAVQARAPGTEVALEVVRGGETITIPVVLDARPDSG